MNDTTRGAIAMVLATAAFNFGDVMMKLLLVELPLGQAIFLRSALSVVVGFGFLGVTTGYARLRDLRHPAVLARSALVTGAMVCFLSALPHVSLAVLLSMLQITPMLTTAMAAVFLKEKVGWRRWTATAVGLLGVLVIINPFSSDGVIGALALLGLATATMNALRDLSTRAAPVTTPTMIIALSAMLGATLVGGGISIWQGAVGTPWAPVSALQAGLIAIAAVCAMAGHFLVSRAMRLGEMSVVSPFRYAVVLWAMFWSWALFSEPPTARVLAGVGIVIAAGIYMMWRERVVGGKARAHASAGAPPAG